MKPIRILSIIGFIIGTILIISSSTLLLLNRNNSENTLSLVQSPETTDVKSTETIEENNDESITVKEQFELKESGWIPNWAFDIGYESLVNNQEIIDTVNPVLYTIDSNGNIANRGVTEDNILKLTTYCKENSILVIPTVGSYDYESMRSSLNNAEARLNNIKTILSEITKYSFDGIDLDYEKIYSVDRNNYIQFLKELRLELSKNKKILSVTVFPQWNNATYHTEQQETIEAQNYTEIGNLADEVRIMTYDYTLQSSKTAGPVGPINWIKQVLDYAIKYIPKEKIWLGVHLYGYEWVGEKTVALTYASVRSILNSSNINSSFREDIGEGYTEFGCEDGKRCIMYYQNKEGVQMRREIAKEYEIAGVSYWRLGGEVDILK